MKKIIKVFVLSLASALFMNALPVNAASPDKAYIVEAVGKDQVILSGDFALSLNQFRRFCGTDYRLNCGDVVGITYSSIDPTFPAQFVNNKEFSVTYLGKAKDYYLDSIQKLTLSKKSDGRLTWTDVEGTEYAYQYHDFRTDGYQYTIDPVSFAVGDSALCAVDDKEVVTIVGFCGDANSDDTVDIMDVIKTNKHLLGAETLEGFGMLAADCDGDGTITSNDSLLLLKTVLEISDSDDVIS